MGEVINDNTVEHPIFGLGRALMKRVWCGERVENYPLGKKRLQDFMRAEAFVMNMLGVYA